MLKKSLFSSTRPRRAETRLSPSFVLASLRTSAYEQKYADVLRSLRPRRTAFLNILRYVGPYRHSALELMPRLALLLTTFIWGATFPATKAALEQIPPLVVSVSPVFAGHPAGAGLVRVRGPRTSPRTGRSCGQRNRHGLSLFRLRAANGRLALHQCIEFAHS